VSSSSSSSSSTIAIAIATAIVTVITITTTIVIITKEDTSPHFDTTHERSSTYCLGGHPARRLVPLGVHGLE
jgi:hypothetical protein